jgi:hypothetical protein
MNRLVGVLLKPHWVFILPPLHLGGCILTAVTNFEWTPVILSEFPAGILLSVIAWRFGHPMIWFGVFGTFWWLAEQHVLPVPIEAGLTRQPMIGVTSR